MFWLGCTAPHEGAPDKQTFDDDPWDSLSSCTDDRWLVTYSYSTLSASDSNVLASYAKPCSQSFPVTGAYSVQCTVACSGG